LPYLECQACGLQAYSAEGQARVVECPVCGALLPPSPLPQFREGVRVVDPPLTGYDDDASRSSRADPLAAAVLAFEGAPIGLALADVEQDRPGPLREVNRALSVLTGRERSELLGSSLDEITVEDDIGLDTDLMAELIGGRIPSYEITKRFRRPDGELFWGELSVSLIRTEGEAWRPVYLVVQLADISHRKHVEEALHFRRDRIANAFDEAPTGMALVTLDGQWLQVNDALCALLDYSEAELITKRVTDMIAHDEVETMQRYLRHVASGQVVGYHVETRALRADGEPFWALLSVSLVRNDEGEPAYLFAELLDIAERKRVEEELEQGALHDGVTGLPSRSLLFDRLEQARRRLARNGRPFAVMLLAADGFDTVGLEHGSEQAAVGLRELASRLVEAVRSTDTVARYSADEFVIVCENVEREVAADVIARRILDSERIRVGAAGRAVEISLTAGIALAADSNDSPAGLVERADAALQAAKGAGAPYQEYCDML
jgi:PAS domain S-box-containing protein/diguanylate cyclase (GGDEF)-like protein